jgi:hypothetical protein
MHKLLVRWFDNSTMTRTIKDAAQLRRLADQLKEGVVYAELTTPSGATSEVTKYFG